MQEAASHRGTVLTFQEVRYVLSAARQLPELSCRQLAAWITDNQGFSGLGVDGLPYLAQGGFGEEA